MKKQHFTCIFSPRQKKWHFINTQKQRNQDRMNKNTAAPVIITLAIAAVTAGIVLSAFMLSRFMLKIQHSTEKSITVKGVAEKAVTADIATFDCSVSVKGDTREAGYAALDKAKKILCLKLDKLGFERSMRTDENISCEEMYRTVTTKEHGKETTNTYFDHYKMTYSLKIRTGNVQLVADNILKIHELVLHKLNVSVGTPKYFITNPEQYKLELVNAASASAAARAETAVRQSKSSFGHLLEARQGVIQITAPASNDTSDYGVYDTASVQKVIRLVMTMKFSLK